MKPKSTALYQRIFALVGLLAAASACTHRVQIQDVIPSEIESTIFLVGDAGEQDPRNSSPVLDSLKALASLAPNRTYIVFLGDNVYPSGIPEEGRAEYADARRRLSDQVDAVPAGAHGIFIPGNHDWAATGPFGLYAVRLEEKMITALAPGRDIHMLPGGGCPGPVAVEIGRLRLITLDTQWWLQNFIVRDGESKCKTDVASVTATLRDLVGSTPDGRLTLVTGHHPLMTGGEHGGYCGITGPFRRFGGASQDIMSSANKTMRDSIESAFKAKPPLMYAAGHDHNLQVMKGAPYAEYFVVSGAGSPSKASCGVYLRESYYVSQHRTGFMRMDILRNKGVLLTAYEYTGGGSRGLPFSRWLEAK